MYGFLVGFASHDGSFDEVLDFSINPWTLWYNMSELEHSLVFAKCSEFLAGESDGIVRFYGQGTSIVRKIGEKVFFHSSNAGRGSDKHVGPPGMEA